MAFLAGNIRSVPWGRKALDKELELGDKDRCGRVSVPAEVGEGSARR